MWPKENKKKVSGAIRILQQKRDASARATHLKAESWKFQSSTIERKQMSTKTSFKRIALVAASALAIAGFSAVPANADAVSAIAISSKSATAISVGTNTLLATNGDATLTAGAAAFVAADVGRGVWSNLHGFIGIIGTFTDTTHVELTAVATVATGTTASGVWYMGTVAATTVATGVVAGQINGMTVTAGSTTNALNLVVITGAQVTTARAKITIGSSNITGTIVNPLTTSTSIMIPFTAPVTAGTYSAVVKYSILGTYLGTTADQFDIPFTITVTAAAALSAASSIVRQAPSSTTGTTQGLVTPTNYTTALDAATYASRATVGTTISTIEVILLNADQTAATQLNTITASITGSGNVRVDETEAVGAAATLRSSSLANTTGRNIMWVHLSTDGTTGPGTVTITVTDAVTGVTTVIGTKTFTSTGAVAKIAVSSSNFKIGATGLTSGSLTLPRTLAGGVGDAFNTGGVNTTPAFVVKATDSTGNASNIATVTGVPSITSSDLTVATGGVCIKDTSSDTVVATITGQGGSTGFYNCTFTIAANAASGNTATLTISTTDPADATGATSLTTTYAVSVGSATIATETITTDSDSYSAGSPMRVTVSAVDAAGNPVADGTGSPLLTANKALGTTAVALAAGFYNAGSISNATSVATSTLFAPSLGGDFLITGTSGNAASSTITATSSVEADESASLALDAANAATDAANNAYDEAQNATQAASDALAATTALAKQVKKLIAQVKKLAKAVSKL